MLSYPYTFTLRTAALAEPSRASSPVLHLGSVRSLIASPPSPLNPPRDHHHRLYHLCISLCTVCRGVAADLIGLPSLGLGLNLRQPVAIAQLRIHCSGGNTAVKGRFRRTAATSTTSVLRSARTGPFHKPISTAGRSVARYLAYIQRHLWV